MIGLTPHKIDFATFCVNVERRLCELGHLVPNQFPMTQREVIRGGKPVGVYFCVHGPRSVKLTAICDFTKNTVIFYGSDGIRRESMQVAVQKPAQPETRPRIESPVDSRQSSEKNVPEPLAIG